MVDIKCVTSNKLSSYRTLHTFERYAEISSLDQFREYCEWAKENNIKLYVLGNGSNTLFKSKLIKTLIVKNKLPRDIQPLPDLRLEVSSSVLVIDVLKYCQEQGWDSFYYLSSVPATIGGALAMNAGRGKQHNCTIYDFVESVTFFEDGYIKTLTTNEIERSYRQTMFTGVHDRFILSAILKFTPLNSDNNLLLDRVKWSKENQDHSAPNCGTVFKTSYSPIMKILRGLRWGQAGFSVKTANWIINKSESSIPIHILIKIAKILHFITLKKVELEIIVID